MRAYLRLDPNLRREKRSYPDGAFRAFVEALCAAEAQPLRGRFESKAILKAMLGPRARWITYLLEHNDLVLEDSGELAVVGWTDWQEGDLTVPERMARLRAKKAAKAAGVTPSVTAEVTSDVTAARKAEAVSGAVGEAEAVAATRNNGSPETMMGFRPRKKKPTEAELLADIKRQHDEAFEVTRKVARGEKPWEKS